MRLNFDSGEIESFIRKLAKTEKYQSLFNAKENGLRLFDNITDISYAQQLLLAYVSMYSSLNTDIFLGDVSERVLENSVFEDSYLLFKSKEHKKRKKEIQQPPKIGERDKQTLGSTEFVFKKRRRE